MAGRREANPGLDGLVARRAALIELLQQLEARCDGAASSEEQQLRSELQQLECEMRMVAGAS